MGKLSVSGPASVLVREHFLALVTHTPRRHVRWHRSPTPHPAPARIKEGKRRKNTRHSPLCKMITYCKINTRLREEWPKLSLWNSSEKWKGMASNWLFDLIRHAWSLFTQADNFLAGFNAKQWDTAFLVPGHTPNDFMAIILRLCPQIMHQSDVKEVMKYLTQKLK